MINSLEGKLVESDAVSAVVEIGGIGYFVSIPLSVTCRLPAIGETVRLQIYPVYREDRQDLYGFLTREERDFFKLIVEKVSGVGPRSALNIMSKLPLAVLLEAVGTGNAEILSKCHGIGKKTAERIITELSDKDMVAITSRSIAGIGKISSTRSDSIGDAMAALISLGYKAVEAEKAIRRAVGQLGDSASTEAIVRAALGT
jgi:Holliday junction DNA helicase RuvA